MVRFHFDTEREADAYWGDGNLLRMGSEFCLRWSEEHKRVVANSTINNLGVIYVNPATQLRDDVARQMGNKRLLLVEVPPSKVNAHLDEMVHVQLYRQTLAALTKYRQRLPQHRDCDTAYGLIVSRLRAAREAQHRSFNRPSFVLFVRDRGTIAFTLLRGRPRFHELTSLKTRCLQKIRATRRPAWYRATHGQEIFTARVGGVRYMGNYWASEPGTRRDGLQVVEQSQNYRRNAAKINHSLQPQTDARYVGVEVECIIPCTREQLTTAMLRARLAGFVSLISDGSIDPDKDRDDDDDDDTAQTGLDGIEVRIMSTEEMFPEILRRTLDVLREVKAFVNSTCGLHVHLDCRKETGRVPANIFTNLVKAGPLLTAMVPKSRMRGTYCVPNSHHNFDTAVGESRYQMINASAYHKHSTIEVRLHSGTVNYSKILNWVKLLVSIADAPTIRTFPDNMKSLRARLNLSPTMVGYIQQRIKQFNGNKGAFLDHAPFGEANVTYPAAERSEIAA